MKRTFKIAGVGVLGILAVIALLLALATAFDWNRVKPWINSKVSDATGRPFAINGDLSLSWERPPEAQVGWKRFIPWPHLRAKDVELGNPDWASTGPLMAKVQQVDFNVAILPLFRKNVVLHSLVLTEPQLNLEKSKDGKNNWTFAKKDDDTKEQSGWGFDIKDLALTEGNIRYVDPAKKADATVRIDTFDDGSAEWKLSGKFNGEKLTGGGKAGALLTLREANVRYPFEAEIKVGETNITANGTITNPADPNALDVNLKILGASMADLFPLSGVVLPETPKFSTEGRVVGKLKPGELDLRYEKFKGKVGASDIGGTLAYKQRDPRPLLSGEVISNYLNLKDLSALVGSDAPKKDEKEKIPPGKILPVAKFKTERWGTMDVQVQFTGKKIIRSEDLPIDNLNTRIKMENGVLSLAPLNFGIAGGRLTSELSIDGRKDPAAARMQVSARGMKLKQMFPGVEEMRASVGEISGDAKLSAAGDSIAAMMASMDGEVKSLVTEGSISKFVLEAIGLNIGSAVVAKLFGDSQVQLNCLAADLSVKDGVMQPRAFIVDTKDATIGVDGNIDFSEEKLNLVIRPESKGVRIISLRSPLYVGGTFKKPDVGVDKSAIALRAGAAAALGTLAAPIAALVALINPGPAEESPCGEFVAQAKKKPTAPAPNPSPKAPEKTAPAK